MKSRQEELEEPLHTYTDCMTGFMQHHDYIQLSELVCANLRNKKYKEGQ